MGCSEFFSIPVFNNYPDEIFKPWPKMGIFTKNRIAANPSLQDYRMAERKKEKERRDLRLNGALRRVEAQKFLDSPYDNKVLSAVVF